MKSKKQIKQLKKNISINTAVNIGYYSIVVEKLPSYVIIDAIKQILKYTTERSTDAEIENILVTEAIKSMNYQDFKEIEKYFFQPN